MAVGGKKKEKKTSVCSSEYFSLTIVQMNKFGREACAVWMWHQKSKMQMFPTACLHFLLLFNIMGTLGIFQPRFESSVLKAFYTGVSKSIAQEMYPDFRNVSFFN